MLGHYGKHITSFSPSVVARKAASKLRREVYKIRLPRRRRYDQAHSTYVCDLPFSDAVLHTYIPAIPIEQLLPYADQVAGVTAHYLAHRFDVLGSGWLEVKHGMKCRGTEGYLYAMGAEIRTDTKGDWLQGRINPANVSEARRIWGLIDEGYTAIDWHVDLKSGYRWTENDWYLDISHTPQPGVDVKVPWELARMQHLPHLAWAYILAENNGEGGDVIKFAPSYTYAREFRNEVLDFIATNPPRFGVNWRGTMDVAIRIANTLVAYDVFRAYGVKFDEEFEQVFSRSVYEHGLHIIHNLEWSRELRTNHYLADIVGLLFVAAYLPRTHETDVWLVFALQELINETGYQFNADGTNFEASSSYHCLSAEMVTYATALVLGLSPEKREALMNYNRRLHRGNPKLGPSPIATYTLPGSDRPTPFPDWYVERLEKMAEFILHSSNPDGRIFQVGDNDSGRFLKLTPGYRTTTVAKAKALYGNLHDYGVLDGNATYWIEDHLNHKHLVAALNGFFNRKDFSAFTGEQPLETDLVRTISGTTAFVAKEKPVEKGVKGGVSLVSYPDFGFYIYRSHRLCVAVRCGRIGQHDLGGHAHNDQLSVEVNVEGVPFLIDPGTYLYTPAPQQRNLFRSTASHTTLAVEKKEQNEWRDGLSGLFGMYNQANAKAIQADEHTFVGEHYGFGPVHRRTIEIQETRVKGLDECTAGGKAGLFFHLAPDVDAGYAEVDNAVILSAADMQVVLKGGPGEWVIADGVYSPAYGILQQNRVVHLRTGADRIEWEIEMAGYYEN